MQTLFETEHFCLYRSEGLSYLKNGVVNQINTGQCNTLLSRIYGLPDEQAEKVIESMLPEIEVIEVIKPKKKQPVIREKIDTYLFKRTCGDKIRYIFRCVIRNNTKSKYYTKRFKDLTEAYKFRKEIKGI